MPATPSRRPASAAAGRASADATGAPAGYSGTPLPKKLGVKPLSRLALFGAPDGFPRTLGALPDGARLVRGSAAADLAVWFVRSRADLRRDIARRARAIPPGGLWIAWRKQSSGEAGDVGEADVRAAGLAAGLVDYKICAVDGTWSGLKFQTRTRTTRRQP
ncbi:MAG TPA: DUF3052 domain-containing protein [Candidatus Polarisedimenticolia bacterium]|jgi:hypothetical protein|nr:DUF3052 domain-containing protein [Candidatus Polarisedimenticolia bacterium]